MLKFAFRNIKRNWKRSIITGLAILIAALMIGLSEAWITGMVDSFVDSYINFQTGNVRIATQGYFDRERFIPVDEIISDSDTLIEEIRSIEEVKLVEERIRFPILLGHGDNTVQAIGGGVDILNSRFNIPNKVISGNVSNDGLFIGKSLAETAGVEVGDDMLLATTTSLGGLNGIKLKVAGICDFKMAILNDQFFFISLSNARRLLKIQDSESTEIYVFTYNHDQTDTAMEKIRPLLPSYVTAKDYKEQMGTMYQMLHGGMAVYYFFEAFILFLASFVIINTMNMNIFERMKEIGTMKALGMTDRQLFLNFTLEGAILGSIGGVLGVFIGLTTIFFVGKEGVDFSSFMQGVDFPMEYVVYPRAKLGHIIIAVLMSVIVPSLSAMIPARFAEKLTPTEALRK